MFRILTLLILGSVLPASSFAYEIFCLYAADDEVLHFPDYSLIGVADFSSSKSSPLISTTFQKPLEDAQAELRDEVQQAKPHFLAARSAGGIRYVDSKNTKIWSENLLEKMSVTTAASLALLKEYAPFLKGPVLEVGPYYLPLVVPGRFPEAQAMYWELDEEVGKFISKTILNGKGGRVIQVDLNTAENSGPAKKKFLKKNYDTLSRIAPGSKGYQAIVVSQVLNYVDLQKAMRLFVRFLAPGGYLFLANPLHHGITRLFHPNRPDSLEGISAAARESGLAVIDERQLNVQNWALFSWVVAKKPAATVR